MRRLTRNSLKSIMVRCFYFNWLLLIRWVFWISVLCNYLSSWGIFTFQLMKCCQTVKRRIYTTGMEKRVLNNTLLAEEAEVLEWTFKTYLASMFSSYSSTLSFNFFSALLIFILLIYELYPFFGCIFLLEWNGTE